MHRFIDGEERTQWTLLPNRLEDYVSEENPVRVIEVFIDELDLAALGVAAAAKPTSGALQAAWKARRGGGASPANDVQLRDPRRAGPAAEHLERPLHEYQLVVVDEAHNYRNPDAPTRAAVLRRLLFGQRRDLLLLTATPVNNSLWDLFHLIRFFVRQDAFLADRGVLSIYERFQDAMRTDPSDLSPDLLYPIIDATCVKRTRQFIQKHYAGDTIIAPDGRRQQIIFPRPQPITVRYALDDPLPALFDDIETALDPDGHPGALTFSRYGAEAFRTGVHDTDEDAQLAATVGLIRSALLKRFESSPYAFQRTLATLIAGHENFLEALDKGHVVTTRFLREIGADDEMTLDELAAASQDTEPASLFDAAIAAGRRQRSRNLEAARNERRADHPGERSEAQGAGVRVGDDRRPSGRRGARHHRRDPETQGHPVFIFRRHGAVRT
jgi:hypothetical protein